MFDTHCYFCHGYGGDARTAAARYLNPPPRDFTAPASRALSRAQMINAVTHGRTATAMQAYAGRLTAAEIAAVVDFVRTAMLGKSSYQATRYHTDANGWRDHARRYATAYPFARGELSLTTPVEKLTQEQRMGRAVFVAVCVTCHVRDDEGQTSFESRPLSYPRNGVTPRNIDGISGATTYARHTVRPPRAADALRAGERLFQQNCAMCHGADGSGRNWIGQFIEPHAADLRALDAARLCARAVLRARIAQGVPGTAMPAWRTVLNDAEIDSVIDYIRGAIATRATCTGIAD